MSTGTRKTGEFCWINMLTPDPAEARAFFGERLGWTYFEMPGIGHGMQVDGRNIGGLFDLNGPNTPKGARAMIGVMVKVENADATCERVRSLGGEAKAAFDIGEQGRMAVLFDLGYLMSHKKSRRGFRRLFGSDCGDQGERRA